MFHYIDHPEGLIQVVIIARLTLLLTLIGIRKRLFKQQLGLNLE